MSPQRFVSIMLFSLLLVFFASCHNDSSVENDISKIEVNFKVERFDKTFLKVSSKDLPKIKSSYPFLFSSTVPDSVWVNKMRDTLQRELLNEVGVIFSDSKKIQNDLESLFQHLKYYDALFQTPRVITLTNQVDYRHKVIANDTLVLIALDNYLGSEHRFYQNIPKYLVANMTANQILPDVANAYANIYVSQAQNNTFLDEMIYFGKLLYFKDKMLPFYSDFEKIGYSPEQLKWAQDNESAIWSYFIEHEMLYSTDSKLSHRFIAEAPFSKFYLEFDRESPGRLGQYIGWQIVRAYANATGDDVLSIMKTEPENIFRKSKFKPKK